MDQPTFYDFRYKRTEVRPTILPLINPASTEVNELSDVLLPVGLKNRDYRIDIIVHVRNKYGQFLEYEGLSVKVRWFLFITVNLYAFIRQIENRTFVFFGFYRQLV
jgi:REJ domain.